MCPKVAVSVQFAPRGAKFRSAGGKSYTQFLTGPAGLSSAEMTPVLGVPALNELEYRQARYWWDLPEAVCEIERNRLAEIASRHENTRIVIRSRIGPRIEW
jgi:hypothetical protein